MHDKLFYMCPPTHFEIEYAINAWTNIEDSIDHDRAMEEWETLKQTYEAQGIRVEVVPPTAGAIELTFIGDSIFLYNGRAISSRFRFSERAAEVPASAAYFGARGFQLHTLPEGLHYEGNGDSLIWNGVMLGGWGIRSDRDAYRHIAAIFDVETIPLQLVQPFYHLDLALCPLNDKILAYYPGAFTPESRELINKLSPRAIPIAEGEVMSFGLNGKVIGNCIVMNGRPCPDLRGQIEALGLRIITVNTDEFNKAGGAAKCLTLEHYQPH